MKILTLCYEWPPVGGGGGRIASKIAAGLAKRGHVVHALVGGISGHTGTAIEDGVVVHRLRSPRRLPDTCSVPEMGGYVLCAILPALRLHRQIRFDVAHAHFAVPTGAVACALSLATGLPYVLTAHLGDVPGGVPEQTGALFRMLMPFTRPIWARAARSTAVSGFVAGLARSAYGISPSIIPNGIDREPLESPPPLPGPIRILFAGRLSIQKNPALAIRSLRGLSGIEWALDVVGDGPLRSEAERICREEGLSARVTFHGWLPPHELEAIRKRCAILLMTSHSEGLPMVAVEALFDGLAIVSSDIPGVRDVLENGINGFASPPCEEALAGALRRLLENPEALDSARRASLQKAGAFRLPNILDSYEGTLRAAFPA